MKALALARALHVLAVVIWIGGVTMATTVALPAIRRGDLGSDRLQAFQAIEHRFAWQARTAVLIVGLTGLYMVWRLDLWSRFRTASFWWMHAMVCLWLLFVFVLFIAEPFILRRRFSRWATERIRMPPSPGCIAAHWAVDTGPHHSPGRGRGQPRTIVLLKSSTQYRSARWGNHWRSNSSGSRPKR